MYSRMTSLTVPTQLLEMDLKRHHSESPFPQNPSKLVKLAPPADSLDQLPIVPLDVICKQLADQDLIRRLLSAIMD